MTHKGQPQNKVTYLALYNIYPSKCKWDPQDHRHNSNKAKSRPSPTEGSWQLQSTMI